MSAADPLLEALERSVLERCHHLLTLADRSPYAATFGCFDRSWWQYKIKDFPSGMSQEALYPLALALEQGLFADLGDGGRTDLEALIAAAADFSLKRQNRNGSVDDYFPFEQAAGATAFSLFAILATARLGRLALTGPRERALRRRLGWLADHRESGRLSNHEALIALCLAEAAVLWGDEALEGAAIARFERLLSWRSGEGWFEEYGGFDVGYESLTFACLVDLADRLPGLAPRIEPVLAHNFGLIVNAAEPDGALGGELFARATWNLFAHGLVGHARRRGASERLAVRRILTSRFLDLPVEVRDDYVLQHHLWSDLRSLALLRKDPLRDAAPSAVLQAPVASETPAAGVGSVIVERSLPQAGHLWVRHGSCLTHVSLAVGGAFRLYRDAAFVVQDSQQAIRCGSGRSPRIWLASAPGATLRWSWEADDRLLIEGPLSRYRPQPMTTIRLLVLRLLMAGGGRFFADRIRGLMQRLLIHAAADPRRRWQRRLHFLPEGLAVDDRYVLPSAEAAAASPLATGFSTFRHVVMSRVFHPYALRQRAPLDHRVEREPSLLRVQRRW